MEFAAGLRAGRVGGATLDAWCARVAARVPRPPGARRRRERRRRHLRRARPPRGPRGGAARRARASGPATCSRCGCRTCPRGRAWRSARCAPGVAVTGVSPAATEPELEAQLGRLRRQARRHAARERRGAGRRADVVAVGAGPARRARPGAVGSAERRAAAVLERHHRAAEGRRHHPPQPLDRGAAVPGRAAADRARHASSPSRRSRTSWASCPTSRCRSPPGATVVTMARFDPARYFELAARHRATVLIGAPPLMRGAAPSGAADLPARRADRVRRRAARRRSPAAVAARFPRAAVGQGWGMTETTCGATMPDRERGTVPGSVGRADAEHGAALVDGELRVRGPQVMAGYLGRPAATAEILDADGLAAHGRRRPHRRRRQRVRRRPPQGADQGQRLPGGARRARGRARPPPGRRRRRRDRPARRRRGEVPVAVVVPPRPSTRPS